MIRSAAVPLIPLPLMFFISNPGPLIAASWVAFAAFVIGGVIYANTGNRFKKRR